MGVFDLPAKATTTNMKQYNGKYGCNYCTDEGELIAKNTRIYPPDAPHHKRAASQIEHGLRMQNRSLCYGRKS